MREAKLNEFVWVIAYIDASYISKVERELSKHAEYNEVKAFIPTIKILKKSFKGKQHFEEVPLLFNYGFFKIPRKYAIHFQYLEALKSHVSCIYAWVKDTSKVYGENPKIRPDGKSVYADNDVAIATATDEEISNLLRETFHYSAHDKDEVDRLKPGDLIRLHSYPWDGLDAEVVSIDTKKREVKVSIKIFEVLKEVKISFDNVFFTMYHNKNYDDSMLLASSVEFDISIQRKSQKNSKDESEY